MEDRSEARREPTFERLLVTGIGRSGTGYMARVLTEAGLPCGHEALYGADTARRPGWQNRRAESSWYAAPWIGSLGPSTLIVHLMRHPVDWLGSWAHTVWPKGKRHSPTMRFLARVTGINWDRLAEEDPLDAAMRLWVSYNAFIAGGWQKTDAVIETKLVETVTARWLAQTLARLGLERSEKHCRSVLGRVPVDVNSRSHPRVELKQLAFREHAVSMLSYAAGAGYGIDWGGWRGEHGVPLAYGMPLKRAPGAGGSDPAR